MSLRTALFLLCFALGAAPADAQRLNANPDSARYITADLDRFWEAYAARAALGDSAAFDSLYLKRGTSGLRDFNQMRIGGAGKLARTVAARPVYYASIRESMRRIAAQEPVVRRSFRALKAQYPDAVFPDVYFVIGRLSTGGTTSDAGLLIGAEMYGRTSDSALVGMSEWHRDVLAPVERLPAIVAHESCHLQQRGPEQTTLLGRALREGMCDFVGELMSGMALTVKAAEWGRAHEHELWQEFSARMNAPDVTGFLYGGSSQSGRPADLGYFIGYQISRAYYERRADKVAALRELFTFTDARRILESSGYAP